MLEKDANFQLSLGLVGFGEISFQPGCGKSLTQKLAAHVDAGDAGFHNGTVQLVQRCENTEKRRREICAHQLVFTVDF